MNASSSSSWCGIPRELNLVSYGILMKGSYLSIFIVSLSQQSSADTVCT